ncbi:MAG TPA: ABC transporter permease, partial [Thermomicrobiales bacterium]|nr:ABC transporter permease [Thermomicrobiales bacterium]
MADLSVLPVPLERASALQRRSSTDHESPHERRRRAWRLSSLWMLAPVALFLLLAFGGPYLVTASPTRQDLLARLAHPFFDGGSWSHPFGTDSLGRDILARIAQGARYSLYVGLIAASGTAVIGITLGMLAGAGGRLADRVVTLLSDVVMAVPFVVIGIVMTAILGQSLKNVLAILIVSGWVSYARIIRLQTRFLVGSEYVLASLAMGASR